MSDGNVQLKLQGSQEDFLDLFSVPASFTETQSGAPEFMKCIFVNAKKKKITAVGASEHQAVEVTDNTIKVLVEGQGLFKASNITTQFSVFSPGDQLTLTLDGDTHEYSIEQDGGQRFISDRSLAIDNSVQVPDVGEFDVDNFIALDPLEFVSALSIVSNSVQMENPRPVFRGLYYEKLSETETFLAGSNGGSSFSSMRIKNSTEVKTPEDGEVRGLLIPGETSARAGLFRQGDVLLMHTSERGEIHFLVRSKGEDLYHIRMAQITSDAEKIKTYPIRQLSALNLSFAQNAEVELKVDRGQLLERLNSAVSIGALDAISEMGSRRQVGIYLQRSDETNPVSTYDLETRVYNGTKGMDEDGRTNYTGVIKFEDSLEVQSHNEWLNGREVGLILHYGLYAGVLRTAPIEDSMELRIKVRGNKPISVNVVKGDIPKSPVDVSNVKAADFDFDLSEMPEFLATIAIEGLYVDEYQD